MRRNIWKGEMLCTRGKERRSGQEFQTYSKEISRKFGEAKSTFKADDT